MTNCSQFYSFRYGDTSSGIFVYIISPKGGTLYFSRLHPVFDSVKYLSVFYYLLPQRWRTPSRKTKRGGRLLVLLPTPTSVINNQTHTKKQDESAEKNERHSTITKINIISIESTLINYIFGTIMKYVTNSELSIT